MNAWSAMACTWGQLGRIALVLLILGASGCTARRWHFEEWVPYGVDHEVHRADLEKVAAASCPITDLLSPRFVSDGCSVWPDGELAGCCVAHDLAYWCGGTIEARRQADQALRDCAAAAGHPIQARLMYWGVRLGGHPVWPFTWRWGYGRRWRGAHWSRPEAPIPDRTPTHWNAGSPLPMDRSTVLSSPRTEAKTKRFQNNNDNWGAARGREPLRIRESDGRR